MADLSNVVRMLIHQLDATRSYLLPSYSDEDEKARAVIAFAESALAAEPPAPAPAADPLPGFAATLIASQRPMDPDVAAALTPEARWEMYDGAPSPAADGEWDHVPDAGNMVAADGEREELAQWLDEEAKRCAAQFHDRITRAAALLRQPAPAPMPVAERPWERPGWCDAEGRCWWFNRVGIPEWQLADGGPYGDFCLPHWAIPVPQPPQCGEVEP